MTDYPCKECILRCNCSEICDKLTTNSIEVYDLMMKHRSCIDCGHTKGTSSIGCSSVLICNNCNSAYVAIVGVRSVFISRHKGQTYTTSWSHDTLRIINRSFSTYLNEWSKKWKTV